MFSEGLEDRGKRFKAMLQYLILREACDFDDEFSRVDSRAGGGDVLEVPETEQEDEFKKKSTEKILREMELKFFDFFVEDDLVENYLFPDVPGKQEANTKKDQFKNQIREQISSKITVINSADAQNHKRFLKEIVRSPKIENSIMTCSMENQSEFVRNGSMDSFLISDIDEVFKLRDLNIAPAPFTNTF